MPRPSWASSIFHQVRQVNTASPHSLEASITDQALQCSQKFQNKQSLLNGFPIPDEWNVLRQPSRSTGKERRAEKALGGHHPFHTYCQVYWEESEWEFFHFVPIGNRIFCIRVEVHEELFTRGLNTVSMKGRGRHCKGRGRHCSFEGAEKISDSGKDNKANIPLDVGSK